MTQTLLNSVGILLLAISVLFNSRTIYRHVKSTERMDREVAEGFLAMTEVLMDHQFRLETLERGESDVT